MRQVSPRSSSLWSLSAALPLCAAMALGCEGNIIGNNNGSGGSWKWNEVDMTLRLSPTAAPIHTTVCAPQQLAQLHSALPLRNQ